MEEKCSTPPLWSLVTPACRATVWFLRPLINTVPKAAVCPLVQPPAFMLSHTVYLRITPAVLKFVIFLLVSDFRLIWYPALIKWCRHIQDNMKHSQTPRMEDKAHTEGTIFIQNNESVSKEITESVGWSPRLIMPTFYHISKWTKWTTHTHISSAVLAMSLLSEIFGP